MIRRYAPHGGLPVWAQPDGNQSAVGQIPPGREVALLEEAEFGWARIGWGDGQEGWVDGELLLTAPVGSSTPPGSSRSIWLVATGVVVLLAAGGVAALVLTGDEAVPGVTPTTQAADGTNPTQAPTEPSTTRVATTNPTGVFDVDDAFIERALATAVATPPKDLPIPGPDAVATALLNEEFAATGLDLTGLEIIVYPLDLSESLVVMLSDDSTALAENEDGMDLLVTALLESPTVERFNIGRLALQHSTVDEEGPVVVTFSVAMSDLTESENVDADFFDRVAVQLERSS